VFWRYRKLVKQRFLAILALSASFFALGVIALGAFTRLIDAGLGCPDWPGCYGHFVVPINHSVQNAVNAEYPGTPLVTYKAWAEMVHRYFVGGLSLFIFIIIGMIFSNKILRRMSNVVYACALLALLIYQIILGQLTVTLKLLPIIVSQHLLGGFFILSTLWLIYLNNRIAPMDHASKKIKKFLPWAIIALILLLLQIALGAWTSTHYASLSCVDFPFCNNAQPFMEMHFKEAFNLFSPVGINYEGGVLAEPIRQTIHMTHRLGALILTIYLFSLMLMMMKQVKNIPELMKSVYIILGLLTVQLCIGMANVILKLPLPTAILHNLTAVLLLIAVITFIYKLATLSHETMH
jgi:cytochrome c oxidase assembly protein subunit 15